MSDEHTTPTVWGAQQQRALDDVARWLRDPSAPQVYRLFGFAGTGKTTLARHLAEGVDGAVQFAAYTGKAASVLRSKGCPGAATLHSLMYTALEADKTRLNEIKDLLARPDELTATERAELRAEAKEERARISKPRFSWNPDSLIRSSKLLVLDECSMINGRIGSDVEEYGTKILVLGDPAQLPPVKGSGYFTNERPDTLLTEIHRQALDNPIIRWSKIIREGGHIPLGVSSCGSARKLRQDEASASELTRSDTQLLTGMNVTRRMLNRLVRERLGWAGSPWPVKGDRLVVLRNDRESGVLNGVVCTALGVSHISEANPDDFQLYVDYEGKHILLDADAAQFYAYKGDGEIPEDMLYSDRRWLIPFDYGYALTVHKAQGSQWGDVTLVDDGFQKRDPGARRRWLYTAVTRAAERLTILV